MRLAAVTRWLAGSVRFRVTGTYPERFWNLCARQGREVWDVRRVDDHDEGWVQAAVYLHLRPLARQAGVRLRVMQRRGLPFARRRAAGRRGLAVGFTACALLVWWLSQCVWQVRVVGVSAIPPERVVALLRQAGVATGTPVGQVDLADLPATLILADPDIAWASVNRHGSVITAEISERVYPPESIDRARPCNVKAARDGRILTLRVRLGVPTVEPGQTVAAGDLLVSGVQEYTNGRTGLHHATAEIIAETERNMTVEMPFEQQQTVPTGRVFTRRAVELFHLCLPLFLTSLHGDFTRTVTRTPLVIGGVELPAAVTTAVFVEQETVTRRLTPDEALAAARAELAARVEREWQGVEILSQEEQVEQGAAGLILRARFFCREDIAKQEELLIFGP